MYRAWRKRFASCLFGNCNSKMIVLTIVATKLSMSNTTT